MTLILFNKYDLQQMSYHKMMNFCIGRRQNWQKFTYINMSNFTPLFYIFLHQSIIQVF